MDRLPVADRDDHQQSGNTNRDWDDISEGACLAISGGNGQNEQDLLGGVRGG